MAGRRINLRYKQRRSVLFGILILLIVIPVLAFTAHTLVEEVIGWCLLGAVLWLFFSINRLSLDESGESLLHQRGFIVPLFTKTLPRHRIKGVRIGQRSTKSGADAGTRFPITLRGITDSRILDHRSMWFSRVIAERLARMLEVPLDNRVWGESSKRDFDELDTPLVERWRREGRVFDKPSLPLAAPIREAMGMSSYTLTFPAMVPQLIYAVVPLFVAAVPAIVDMGASDFFHSTAYRIFAAFFVILAIFMMAMTGRSRLTIDEKKLTFRQGMFILRQKILLDEIEEMFIQFDGIGFIGDRSAVWINWSGSKEGNEYMAAVVPYQLNRIWVAKRPPAS